MDGTQAKFEQIFSHDNGWSDYVKRLERPE
jgi:hypothetical protein